MRHLVSVFYAHAEEILHGFELFEIILSDLSDCILIDWVDLVDELDDGAGSDLILGAEDGADHEVLDVFAATLVIYFVLEFGFLLRILRHVNIFMLEDVATDARVGRELCELGGVDGADFFGFLLLGERFVLLLVVLLLLLPSSRRRVH